VDLLVEVGVLAVGGPFGQRSLGLRPEADAWLAGARSRRWADLAVAWRSIDLAVEDHLVSRRPPAARRSPTGDRPATAHREASSGHPAAEPARPLAGRRLAAAAARRRTLMEILTGPGGAQPSAADVGTLAGLLAWRRPMVWPDPAGSGPDDLEATARAVLEAAAFLGVAVAEGERPQAGEGRTQAGRAQAGLGADGWVAGNGPAELAEAAEAALPDGPDRFLLAGDLTVVAPGGLAPGVEARLAGLADREAAGSGTWRIHDASLRRAFDEGRSADEVLEFLRRHSSTPLPQALEYLVADVARRHGRLRVGGATTYLRGDPATVAGAVRSAAGRRLGLRELAPGVAVTGRSQHELLAALRKTGEAPLAEEPDGSPRPEGARPVRHVQRVAPDRLDRSAATPNGHGADRGPEIDPATAVDRLRGRRPDPAHRDPTQGDQDPVPARYQPTPGEPDPAAIPDPERRVARG
jgi:hypothetical protein